MGKNADDKKQKNKSESLSVRKLSKEMEEIQDSKRYYHTLGVAFTACSLAMCHDVNIEDAQRAGLLHDCAKCLSDKKLIEICERNHLEISDVEYRNPYLLHGKAGAFLAKTKYQIEDQDILNAICHHTTGRPGMSKLEKIIFIADYIEPGRKQASNLPEVRKMAFQDLDRTMLKILKDILGYLATGDGEIDPMTQKTFDYYQKITK